MDYRPTAMQRNAQTEREPFAPVLWTTAAFVAGALLNVDRIPPWASAVLVACAAWQLSAAAGRVPMPPRAMRIIVALVLVACVLASFHTLNGLPAGTVLLVVMGSTKLLETRSRRDRYIVIGAALFLLLAACLDRQGLIRVPLYLLQAGLCCIALAFTADGGAGLNFRVAGALVARSLFLALPLALILFLFFPRLPGGFWALPASEDAVTGLSDTMSPGSISELTASYDPAFRARFQGAAPPPEERYWRGPALHEFDGYTWRRGAGQAYRQQPLRYLGQPYRYSITLAADSNRWWLALDTVAGSPDRRVLFTYDYTLVARTPVTEATTYDALSYTHTESADALSNLARRKDTALPENRNPRTRALALRLREKAATDSAFVRAALDYLRTGGFQYSVTPPKLDFDSVDDFLFHTREGFCGHYASAFAVLMRAGGVPARVVTGYQGGEWNPIGGYFVIRQSDAHAWTEVWIDGRGWRRIDPTAVVAPERLRRGILDLLPNAVSGRTRLMHAAPWITDILQGWDALNTAWNERVVKFDVNMQLGILERLGVRDPNWTALIAALSGGLIAWLAWIAWHVGRSAAPRPRDRLARAYARLCRKLARAGLKRDIDEGPLDYADRIAKRRPDLAPRAQPLLTRYAHLRYGPMSGAALIAAIAVFERMVRRLQVARRSANTAGG
jgi:transglutaminase-like putative cysteine protease